MNGEKEWNRKDQMTSSDSQSPLPSPLSVFHMIFWSVDSAELSVSRTPGYHGGNVSGILYVSKNTRTNKRTKKTQTIPPLIKRRRWKIERQKKTRREDKRQKVNRGKRGERTNAVDFR